MKLGKLIVDNQSKEYYELINLKTNDIIVGSDISTYMFGLLVAKATTTKDKGVL